jgi:hypothetical protein
MKDEQKIEQANRASGAAIAFILAIVFFVVLSVGVKLLVRPPAIDADRAELRYKALADMRANEDKVLNTPAIIDKQHGTVQLPIDTAIQIAAEKWAAPGAARADLAARVAKATAPIKPVSFE